MRNTKGGFGNQGFTRERSPVQNGRFARQERGDVSSARERNGRSDGFGKRFGSSERGRDFSNRRWVIVELKYIINFIIIN